MAGGTPALPGSSLVASCPVVEHVFSIREHAIDVCSQSENIVRMHLVLEEAARKGLDRMPAKAGSVYR